MNQVFRIAIGVGLLVFGYWLGREVGRAESGRSDPQEAREQDG
jgi:hypothetical protein